MSPMRPRPTGTGTTPTTKTPTAAAAEGQLLARPAAPVEAGATGVQRLDIGVGRNALVAVPGTYRPDQPAPLALMLHGAGGDAPQGLGLIRSLADEHGIILLAVPSQRQTWDVIMGEYGPDVAAIDRALTFIFGRYAVDPARVAVGGFSDGASYALSLGVANGALFSHVIAFSPGFMAPARIEGEPRLFLSHGTQDAVLPIDRCSRRLVPRLEGAGYEVRYREFEGPHTVPGEIAREAVDWFLAPS